MTNKWVKSGQKIKQVKIEILKAMSIFDYFNLNIHYLSFT